VAGSYPPRTPPLLLAKRNVRPVTTHNLVCSGTLKVPTSLSDNPSNLTERTNTLCHMRGVGRGDNLHFGGEYCEKIALNQEVYSAETKSIVLINLMRRSQSHNDVIRTP
jgi:hypothetical protein